MTPEEIIKLAREAGDDWDSTLPDDREFLFRFATLIRNATLDEAAEEALDEETGYWAAAAIRELKEKK